MDCNTVIQKLKKQRQQGAAIVVAGVGSGITAGAAAKGGADILATYNTAAYRSQGLPTGLAFLPYDNCNELSFSLVPQVAAAAKGVPLLIGLGAHDPRRSVPSLLDRVQELGLAGVANEPFIGMYGGDIRAQMEAAGLGFDREVSLLREAARRGLLTLGYAFTPEEAVELACAGVHILSAMVGGVTSGGDAGGAGTISVDEAAAIVREIVAAAERENPDLPVLAHGGPLNDVETVQRVLDASGAAGYVTGSTGERIPVEKSVRQAIGQFKTLKSRWQ